MLNQMSFESEEPCKNWGPMHLRVSMPARNSDAWNIVRNCTNVNVSSKTDFWWNSIVWKNKIILNYTLIMDPTYYFHIFPVYVPWIVYIYTWFKLIRIKSTEVYLEYRWYYRSFCISKWFSVILFILKSLILTLKMEVQKFRKFSANPFESIFKVNDSH